MRKWTVVVLMLTVCTVIGLSAPNRKARSIQKAAPSLCEQAFREEANLKWFSLVLYVADGVENDGSDLIVKMKRQTAGVNNGRCSSDIAGYCRIGVDGVVKEVIDYHIDKYVPC